MIRVAICEDEPNIRSYLTALVRRQEATCEIAAYDSADAYLAAGKEYDLLFLDIELVGPAGGAAGNAAADGCGTSSPMDGIALARKLRGMDLSRQPLIVFVTGHDDYIYEAFDVEAFQYLMKPIDEKRFAELFRRARERIAAEPEQQRKSLVIQLAGVRKVVPWDSIYYAESQGHKILLHRKDGILEYYGKISELEQSLAGQFSRIHKGYLVNLSYVEEYDHVSVRLENGDRLVISKYKYDDFAKAHLRFLQQSPL